MDQVGTPPPPRQDSNLEAPYPVWGMAVALILAGVFSLYGLTRAAAQVAPLFTGLNAIYGVFLVVGGGLLFKQTKSGWFFSSIFVGAAFVVACVRNFYFMETELEQSFIGPVSSLLFMVFGLMYALIVAKHWAFPFLDRRGTLLRTPSRRVDVAVKTQLIDEAGILIPCKVESLSESGLRFSCSKLLDEKKRYSIGLLGFKMPLKIVLQNSGVVRGQFMNPPREHTSALAKYLKTRT
jgi:hypothetical protein